MKIQKLALAVVGVSFALLATGELFTRFVDRDLRGQSGGFL
jgi:hypothetical protein